MNSIGGMTANGPMIGNPSGVGQPAANMGTPTNAPTGASVEVTRRRLNTYIYDYFLRHGMYDSARQLIKDGEIEQHDDSDRKNGHPMADDGDLKDDIPGRPADLPRHNIPSVTNNSFLLDWWSQFWDHWTAARTNPNSAIKQYLRHVHNQKGPDRQRMMANTQMQAMNVRNGLMPNGVPMGNDMKKAMMMQGNRQPNQAQIQQMRLQHAQMVQDQMQREGSQIDANGQPRPQTPGSGDAPSPKRQRLEGGAFNGQMMPMGRGQAPGMPGQFNGMPMPPNPNAAKNINMYANAVRQSTMQMQNMQAVDPDGKGPNGLSQGSPAMDGHMDLMNVGSMRGIPPGGPNAGSHALQDYQMQLMLLEQQNKKRLLMARQEQEGANGPGGPMNGGGGGGNPGFMAPQMSPSNSRTGPSPNPDDQMKRDTPKMIPGGIPPQGVDGGMQGRASPAPGFDPSQMNQGMNPGMNPGFLGMKMPAGMVGPNGQLMPAANSHPAFNAQMNGLTPQHVEMMRQQNAGKPGGPWQQGPPGMMQAHHQQQQQQQQNMTPQQRNSNMPPPPAPATGEGPNRTQPSSPNQNAAPPTPSQANKPNPKNKKGDAKQNKKPSAKKGQTAATPASESGDQPPTPTPAPPITPTAPSQQFGKNNPMPAVGGPQPLAQQGIMGNQQPPPEMSSGPFGGVLEGGDMNFSMEFTGIDGSDVLENFDFDAFLHTDDGANGAFAFDGNMDFDAGLEAGGDV